MLYLIANKVALWIFDDKDNKKENVELCKYGLELFISSFFCSIVLIAFGFVTTSIIESIIFIVAFSALRIYTGGYHANSYSLCTLITVAIYALILFVYRRFTFAVQSNIVSLFVFSFSLIIIFLFSPVRNQHKKIDKNQYKAIKIKAVVVLVIEYINYLTLFNMLGFTPIALIVPTLLSIDIMILIPIIKNKGAIKDADTSKKDYQERD